MLWADFQKPKKLESDPETLTGTYGRFTAQPFERGFGTTIGNALRRVLLSSIEGAAVTAVKVEGVQHEFSSLNGVVEDMTDVVLNLKQIPFRLHSRESKTLFLDKKGPAVVTAADFEGDADVEILDPSTHIATLSREGKIEMEVRLKTGRGYTVADRNADADLPVGYIPVDSVHSPVRRVNFHVEGARVGQRTDYDRLVLEVWTNGTITPEEAVSNAARLLADHLGTFMTIELPEGEVEQPDELGVDSEMGELLSRTIEDLDLSVRSANCLKNANIRTLGDLVQRSEREMLSTKNFGKKSLDEIRDVLDELGLSFGMNLRNPERREAVHANE
ncbi:MAG: DNA-directed RNA polymerase subunit alpha [Acidobacteria bacterium]|nr:DNA-directed RNA polymerase subunit alpha [Acidobacteriota bacterium]